MNVVGTCRSGTEKEYNELSQLPRYRDIPKRCTKCKKEERGR